MEEKRYYSESDISDLASNNPYFSLSERKCLDAYSVKVINYMADKAKQLNVNKFRLGDIELIIEDNLTYIKCALGGEIHPIWKKTYACKIDQDNPLDNEVYFGGMVAQNYTDEDNFYGNIRSKYRYGNICIGKRIIYSIIGEPKYVLTAVCNECARSERIYTCEICHTFMTYSLHTILNENFYVDRCSNRSLVGYNLSNDFGRYTICNHCEINYANDDAYVICDGCGDIILGDDCETLYEYDDDNIYCADCARETRERYEDEQQDEDDDYYENNGEWEDLNRSYINEYHGANHTSRDCGSNLVFGAEYEILCFDNSNLEDYDDRKEFCQQLSRYGEITRDSSVDLEIVTTPMTLDKLRGEILGLAKVCRSKRISAWNENKCGLHIHINRAGIKNFTNIYHFLKENRTKLFKLSGRTKEQSNHYCRFDFPAEDCELLEECDRYTRYLAVNLQNRRTVEFRFFRNTTNENRLNAYFDFMETLFKYDDDLPSYNWNDFIKLTKNEFLMNMFNIEDE